MKEKREKKKRLLPVGWSGVVMLPFNPSWLQDAVKKLFVYHTPNNVIRKIKGDVIYGNPPWSNKC